MKTILIIAALITSALALEFDTVRILPRQDNPTAAHIPKRWTLESSQDAIAWAPLKEGAFDSTLTEKLITVPQTRARYIRFTSLESHSVQPLTALAEIGVFFKGKEYSTLEWKATSGNEVGITDNLWGPASYAIDDTPETCWHTRYMDGETLPFPHVITIDFGADVVSSDADKMHLEWEPNPPVVDEYVLNYGKQPDHMTSTLSVPGNVKTATVPSLTPGEWFFTVSAKIEASQSESSKMAVGVIATPAPPAVIPRPKGLRVVRIEASANLKDWEPVAFVPLMTDAPARFVRASITDISTP